MKEPERDLFTEKSKGDWSVIEWTVDSFPIKDVCTYLCTCADFFVVIY